MKLSDKKRPRNERGMVMLVFKGKPVAICPSANIYFTGTGKIDIAFHACYKEGTARYYRSTHPLKDAQKQLDAYEADPEKYLSKLGWSWQ